MTEHIRNFFSKDKIRAVNAKFEAQKIAFAPYAFQAARALRNFGILQALYDSKEVGLTKPELIQGSGLSEYSLSTLLEMGLSMEIIKIGSKKDSYILSKTGFFLLHDPMTVANMDFMHDVCFKGAFDLESSLKEGKPTGLKHFGNWPTVYEGLSKLPEEVQKSWFAFDHYYSDNAFPYALPVVFKFKPKKLLDIGGNTAKWALAATGHDSEVKVTIVDLPGQAVVALKNASKSPNKDRILVHEANLLDPQSKLPHGHDAVWMSQFLDCFALTEVTSILKKIHEAVDSNAHIFVMEPLWDKQNYPAAVYSLHATSLYFTNIANGNSKMYSSQELSSAIEIAGFEKVDEIHDIGPNDYSILVFKKR